jgi:hypothetical protein
MSDDFGSLPNPDEFEYDEDGFQLPHKPKHDDPRKGKGQTFDWMEIWIRAVTKPEVSIYREHLADPQASFSRALVWMFAASVVGSLLQAIATSMASMTGTGMFGLGNAADVSFPLVTALCCAPFFAVIGVIFFVIFNGIQYVFAMLLGGKGGFEDQVYSVATYAAPLSLIMGGVGMIPCFGPLAVLGVALYALFLNVIALESVHLFDRGRALIASLAWLLLLCLCPIVLIILLITMGVAVGSGIQDIIDQIITPTPSVLWSSLRFALWVL